MGQFYDAEFVGSDTLEFIDFKNVLFLAGEIGCKGRIVIGVTKLLRYLDADADPHIQTVSYAYNVSVSGQGNVFRYDNQHSENPHTGHPDPHHKHHFDWPRGDEVAGSPEWLGADKWPTLGEVITEAQRWHSDHYSELDAAEAYPESLQSGLRV